MRQCNKVSIAGVSVFVIVILTTHVLMHIQKYMLPAVQATQRVVNPVTIPEPLLSAGKTSQYVSTW